MGQNAFFAPIIFFVIARYNIYYIENVQTDGKNKENYCRSEELIEVSTVCRRFKENIESESYKDSTTAHV